MRESPSTSVTKSISSWSPKSKSAASGIGGAAAAGKSCVCSPAMTTPLTPIILWKMKTGSGRLSAFFAALPAAKSISRTRPKCRACRTPSGDRSVLPGMASLDLLPEGRENWMPKHFYCSDSGSPLFPCPRLRVRRTRASNGDFNEWPISSTRFRLPRRLTGASAGRFRRGFLRWWAADVTEDRTSGNVEPGFFNRATVYGLHPVEIAAPRRAIGFANPEKNGAARGYSSICRNKKARPCFDSRTPVGRRRRTIFSLHHHLGRTDVPHQSSRRRKNSRAVFSAPPAWPTEQPWRFAPDIPW